MHTEFEVGCYEQDVLSIFASQDPIYYREAEIRFHGVQAVAGKFFWKTEAYKPCIEFLDGTEEAYGFNASNRVEVGHSISKMPNEDGHALLIAAESVEFIVGAVIKRH